MLTVLMSWALGAAPQAQDDAPKWVHLEVDPLVDLWCWVVRASELPGPFSGGPEPRRALESVEGGEELIAAARRLHATLEHPLAWGVLTSTVPGCSDATMLEERFEEIPEPLSTFVGDVSIRDDALEFAGLLAEFEPTFREEIWPERSVALRAAADSLAQTLLACAPALYADIAAAMEFDPTPAAAPVYLVADAPSPGGITFATDKGTAFCFVGLRLNSGGRLVETVVHESLHALDVRDADDESALATLRAELAEAGIGPRDRAMRDVPHLVMFVQAAEAVRRHLDVDHIHYGVETGLYGRFGPLAAVVRAEWTAWWEGETTREAALASMVSAAQARRSD